MCNGLTMNRPGTPSGVDTSSPLSQRKCRGSTSEFLSSWRRWNGFAARWAILHRSGASKAPSPSRASSISLHPGIVVDFSQPGGQFGAQYLKQYSFMGRGELHEDLRLSAENRRGAAIQCLQQQTADIAGDQEWG